MGLPKDDWPYVHELSERMLASQDPDVAADEGDRGSMLELAGYAMNFAAERRAQEPRADVTTVLLQEDFGGRQLTDMDFASFFVQLVGAGNDTTRRTAGRSCADRWCGRGDAALGESGALHAPHCHR
jgi:cytochrome P450